MSQTVAEALVDLMVRAGITHVYGIVGDSANPIVDAMRRHSGDDRARPRPERGSGRVRGRGSVPDLGPADCGARLVRARAACTSSTASTTASGTARSVFAIATHIPSNEIGTDYFQETAPEQIFAHCCAYVGTISTPGQMPLIAELAMQAAIQERGVGMVILPGDIGAATIEHPLLQARRGHRAAARSALRGGARQGGRADRQGEAHRDLRRRRHAGRARRGAAALADPQGSGRVRLPRQGRSRARQPGRRRHDRPARLGRRGEGARRLRPAADARHGLPVSAVPASPTRRSSRSTTRRPISAVARTSASASSATSARRSAPSCPGSSSGRTPSSWTRSSSITRAP